jgi:hypothetical protein
MHNILEASYFTSLNDIHFSLLSFVLSVLNTVLVMDFG